MIYQTISDIQCLRDGILWGWVKTLYPCGSLQKIAGIYGCSSPFTHCIYLSIYLYIYMYVYNIYISIGIVSIAKKIEKKSYFRDKSLLYLSLAKLIPSMLSMRLTLGERATGARLRNPVAGCCEYLGFVVNKMV